MADSTTPSAPPPRARGRLDMHVSRKHSRHCVVCTTPCLTGNSPCSRCLAARHPCQVALFVQSQRIPRRGDGAPARGPQDAHPQPLDLDPGPDRKERRKRLQAGTRALGWHLLGAMVPACLSWGRPSLFCTGPSWPTITMVNGLTIRQAGTTHRTGQPPCRRISHGIRLWRLPV